VTDDAVSSNKFDTMALGPCLVSIDDFGRRPAVRTICDLRQTRQFIRIHLE
jgi:hypothetical protein